MTRLHVMDEGRPLSFGFDEMNAYHGGGFPGGVAHGFKVLERALPLISPDGPPERREISIETAFPGPGARDAIEMVTRAVLDGRYVVDAAFAPPGTIESPAGHYFFRLTYRGRAAELTLRPGNVLPEFVTLARRKDRTAADEARLMELKIEMATRLMPKPANEVYDATVRSV